MSQDEVEEVLEADLSEVPADQYGAETRAYDSQATYDFQGAATAEANNIWRILKGSERPENKKASNDQTITTRDGEEVKVDDDGGNTGKIGDDYDDDYNYQASGFGL